MENGDYSPEGKVLASSQGNTLEHEVLTSNPSTPTPDKKRGDPKELVKIVDGGENLFYDWEALRSSMSGWY